jgi:integrase
MHISLTIRLGQLPYSYTGVCRELARAATAANLGHLGTHTFRHTYRSWLDAVGTAVAVQQKATQTYAPHSIFTGML